MASDGTKPAKPIRGRKRLRLEKRRLQGENPAPPVEEGEMAVEETEGIPKLKSRKVVKGKFARRQGYLLSFRGVDVSRR
jgi:hypothetical protein